MRVTRSSSVTDAIGTHNFPFETLYPVLHARIAQLSLALDELTRASGSLATALPKIAGVVAAGKEVLAEIERTLRDPTPTVVATALEQLKAAWIALKALADDQANKVREALLGGFASSRVLEVHGDRALKGTYKPGFKTHLFAKDMRNVVSTLAEHDTAAPVTAVVQQLLNATMAAGRGEDDNSIMAKTVFELSGVE